MSPLVKARTKANPAFYVEELRHALGEQRAERALTDPESLDLLTWNVFASLDTHEDRDWLAHRLASLGGTGMRAPVRISLWSGVHTEPILRPSPEYVAFVRERAAAAGQDASSVRLYGEPIEVGVRIESPDVLVLVDTVAEGGRTGSGGRDRVIELVDAGLEQARRLSTALAVAVVYPSGTSTSAELSARINRLRDPATLAAEMPWRRAVPPVLLRELPWQQLLRMWDTERDWLHLGMQPAKAFLEHCRRRGL